MRYAIKAKKTKYRDYVFRSRLEAKWAAMFDLLRWQWDYEPVDFNGWIPDFAIYGKQIVYVEVKPTVEFLPNVARKIGSSGCSDDVLIVGQRPIVGYFCDSPAIGWISECASSGLGTWGNAFLARWGSSANAIGFAHSFLSYQDRISGSYDGDHFYAVDEDYLQLLWASAHNATQWWPK